MGVSTYTLVSSVTRTAVTTTMSGGAGAISALFTQFYRTRTWDLLSVRNDTHTHMHTRRETCPHVGCA